VPDGLLRPNWGTTGVGEGVHIFSQWEAVKRVAVGLMREYESRVNGSVLREYGSFVAWDFRAVDAEWAGSQARFLAADLEAAIREGGEGFERDAALGNVAITMRKTRVEVSLRFWNKGRLARDILARVGSGLDFVLAIGDDATDEACFAAVAAWREEGAAAAAGAKVFPVTVGRKLAADTKASAYLADVAAVHALLELLAQE
jgi:trehalose-phosphatase